MIRRLLILTMMFMLAAMPTLAPSVAAEVVCSDTTPEAAASPEASPAPSIPEATFPEDGGSLTIFAAASLTDAFGEMKTRLEADHPSLEISIEAAGSQTLVTQLQQGAQADVLATANLKWMDTAVESDLVAGEPVVFTGNRLVIVAPENNPAGITSIDDLAGDGVSLILAGPDVPAGSYAQQAFCTYASSDAAPEGFIDSINANLVSEEVDVRSVLAKIQLGEADAGVVYASDAAAATLSGTPLTVIEFPTTVPTSADYPIAALSGGNVDLANAFIAYVMSDEGQAILADYGFTAE
ncbi:MAG TPA: molybdate ABC transporter substrate-binding protein [Thermomicrobiales bacterium]|nr:molybdate ABC transporter substrate-binding protein [Thermomicrobiales bacterium]